MIHEQVQKITWTICVSVIFGSGLLPRVTHEMLVISIAGNNVIEKSSIQPFCHRPHFLQPPLFTFMIIPFVSREKGN